MSCLVYCIRTIIVGIPSTAEAEAEAEVEVEGEGEVEVKGK